MDLLASALDREASDRAAFLDEACADDPSLRREVESLLASDEPARILEGLAFAVAEPEVPASPPETRLVGEILDGKYRLERLLGRGGMGAVYLATHVGTDRSVAVKLIARDVEGRAEFVERFRREARAAGRLRHPGVVDVTDFGVATVGAETLPYLVMEYLDGLTLAQLLREEGRLPIAWVVDILEQTCSAVQEAHDQGIVHRDLKPDNLWLEPNRRGGFTVKVLDFGLAKLGEPARSKGAVPAAVVRSEGATRDVSAPPTVPLQPRASRPSDVDGETLARTATTAGGARAQPSSRQATDPEVAALTRVGDVMGTPAYMSPEQCRGLPLDARSDVYSLGVITYRLLAGAPPFAGDSWTVLQRHVDDPPPALRERTRGVSKSVADLVMEALAKDPSLRPRSATAFATALRARSEGAGALVQRLVVMLGERYLAFLRLSALGHAPLAVVSLVLATTGQWLGHPGTVGRPTLLGARGLLVLSVALSALASSALCEAAVMRSLVEPLRPLTLGPLLTGLRRRSRAYLTTLAPFLALAPYLILMVVLADRFRLGGRGILLLAAPILVAFAWMILNLRAVLFLSSVIHVEGLSGRAALRRSAELSRQAVRLLPAVGQAALLTALLAGPVWASLAYGVARLETLATHPGWPALGPVTVAGLAGLLAAAPLALGLPIFAVSGSLLYFRTREAGGESLAEILGRFEGDDMASTWRTGLRERVRERISSGA